MPGLSPVILIEHGEYALPAFSPIYRIRSIDKACRHRPVQWSLILGQLWIWLWWLLPYRQLRYCYGNHIAKSYGLCRLCHLWCAIIRMSIPYVGTHIRYAQEICSCHNCILRRSHRLQNAHICPDSWNRRFFHCIFALSIATSMVFSTSGPSVVNCFQICIFALSIATHSQQHTITQVVTKVLQN